MTCKKEGSACFDTGATATASAYRFNLIQAQAAEHVCTLCAAGIRASPNTHLQGIYSSPAAAALHVCALCYRATQCKPPRCPVAKNLTTIERWQAHMTRCDTALKSKSVLLSVASGHAQCNSSMLTQGTEEHQEAVRPLQSCTCTSSDIPVTCMRMHGTVPKQHKPCIAHVSHSPAVHLQSTLAPLLPLHDPVTRTEGSLCAGRPCTCTWRHASVGIYHKPFPTSFQGPR